MTRDAEHTPTGYEDAASVVVNQAPAGEVERLVAAIADADMGGRYDDRADDGSICEVQTEDLRAILAALSPEAPAREAKAFAMKDGMTTHPTLRSANIARQDEWDQDGQITASYRGNELAGEVGEACNVIKKLERERLGILGSRATVGELADELADVLICADLIAMHYGIDLEAAVARKFNATSEKVGLQTRLATPNDGGEA